LLDTADSIHSYFIHSYFGVNKPNEVHLTINSTQNEREMTTANKKNFSHWLRLEIGKTE